MITGAPRFDADLAIWGAACRRVRHQGALKAGLREWNDGHRRVDGKRLEYRESVDNPPYLVKLIGQLPAPFEGQ